MPGLINEILLFRVLHTKSGNCGTRETHTKYTYNGVQNLQCFHHLVSIIQFFNIIIVSLSEHRVYPFTIQLN